VSGGLGAWLRERYVEPEAPLVAVEIRSRALGVVRVAREGGRRRVAAAAVLELPAGWVEPSLALGNVKDPEALKGHLRAALERTGVLGGAHVALVVPDPAVRVALLPQADVPAGKPAETDEIVRFKLRKSLPFDVKDAAVSVARPGAPGAGVLVAVMQQVVLREYEVVCEALGLRPGLVMPSSIALATALAPTMGVGHHLLLNWDENAACIVLVREGWPLLVRTFGGEGAVRPEAVARELASTGVYLTERLGAPEVSSLVVRAAHPGAREGLDALRMGGMPAPRLADPWATLGGAVDAVSQPLAGAAAALAVRPAA
jgi:hypothetical protein